jgi:hypothetical protein
MASTPQGDISNNRFFVPQAATFAAVASGGANARLGQIGPFSFPVRLREAWYCPTGADQSATQSATYRRIDVINGGAAGTVTASANRMGTLGLTATQASLGAASFAVDSTVTVPSGNVIYASQSTVGGTDANGTVLAAGQLALAFEVI